MTLRLPSPESSGQSSEVAQRLGALTGGAVRLTPMGLEFVCEPTWDEWYDVITSLRGVETAVRWWIGDALSYGERRWGERYAQAVDAAEVLPLSVDSVRNCQWVAEQCEFGRRRPKLSWSHHREVAALDPTEQDALLDAAERDSWSRNELRKAVRAYRRALAASQAGPLPDGKFDVILADPPWPYDFAESERIGPDWHYPTMELEEILDLPIPAADDAVLYLWATAPKMREAMNVVDAWGFTYRTHAVWDKMRSGVGYWFLGRHEPLLVATRGEFSPPEPRQRMESVMQEAKSVHSRKPAIVYEHLERSYPNPPHRRLEMFARREREGWTVWGNEVDDGVRPAFVGTPVDLSLLVDQDEAERLRS